jgi:hypothetical protein
MRVLVAVLLLVQLDDPVVEEQALQGARAVAFVVPSGHFSEPIPEALIKAERMLASRHRRTPRCELFSHGSIVNNWAAPICNPAFHLHFQRVAPGYAWGVAKERVSGDHVHMNINRNHSPFSIA